MPRRWRVPRRRPIAADGPALAHLPARQHVRRLAYRLPPSLRADAIDAVRSQARALRALGRLVVAVAREVGRLLPPRAIRLNADRPPPLPVADRSFAELAAPGDILLMLAASWSHPDYAGLINRRCKANGLRFALLIHDLVPARCPGVVQSLRSAFVPEIGSIPCCRYVTMSLPTHTRPLRMWPPTHASMGLRCPAAW